MNKIKTIKNISIPMDKIDQFCQKWSIVELSLFGSVIRDDFRPDSDIDILVKFADHAKITLFDLTDIKDELTKIFARKIDLISKKGIEASRNYLRKTRIINSAKVIYERA